MDGANCKSAEQIVLRKCGQNYHSGFGPPYSTTSCLFIVELSLLPDPKVALGDSCVTGDICADNSALCTDGLCQCRHGFGADSNQDNCGKSACQYVFRVIDNYSLSYYPAYRRMGLYAHFCAF